MYCVHALVFSLKIAREADPEGIRTIGVVTKVDTMEEGADCADVLLGKIYPLRRGYVQALTCLQKPFHLFFMYMREMSFLGLCTPRIASKIDWLCL